MAPCVPFLKCCGISSDMNPTSSTGSNLSNLDSVSDFTKSTPRARNKTRDPKARWPDFADASSSDNYDLDSQDGVGRRQSTTPENAVRRRRSLVNGRLLDQYHLGEVLGQGSFGIVFACKAKRPENPQEGDLAVKLIDKVESPPEDIEREIAIQRTLDHVNLLKVHEVINEKCFTCIVTDRCAGGDLVKSLQGLANAGRRVRSGKIIHIARQMLHATFYLHGYCIVHRDIKADNFLLDRENIMDPKCRVRLADFGFSCECKTGDRLRRRCGTRSYWPPELWDRNYAIKVDIWAMGVTLYGIVEGALPFHSEWEVKHKDAVSSTGVAPKCSKFIQTLLTKVEAHRPATSEALTHEWVYSPPSMADTQDAPDVEWGPGMDVIQAEVPDPAVAARRLELVDRLEGVHVQRALKFSIPQFSGLTSNDSGLNSGSSASPASGRVSPASGRISLSGCHSNRLPGTGAWTSETSDTSETNNLTPLAVFSSTSFQVIDKLANKIRTFEWWKKARVEFEGLHQFTGTHAQPEVRVQSQDARKFINKEVVGQMLEAQGIDTSQFGKGFAKSLDRFADEVESGASQLLIDAAKHKALVRVVDVVLLRLACSVGDQILYLIVSADEQEDGRMRSDLNRLPGTKKKPHENVKNAAERIVADIPDVTETSIVLNFECKEIFEEDEESPSYPGVRTVYRKEIVEGRVEQQEGTKHLQEKLRHKGSRSTKFFSWLTQDECLHKGVKLHAPTTGFEVSSLVPAPIGLKLRALGRYLKANNIDPSAFGRNQTKTLQELSTELVTGESSLATLPNGTVVRIVDVVLLTVTKAGTNDILVVTKEAQRQQYCPDTVLNRLPGTKRRPDENHFLAAKRVLQRQLKVNENLIDMDASDVHIVEEEKDSPSYPGLRTVYCKRIINAVLGEPDKLMPGASSIVSTQNIPTEHRPRTFSGMVPHMRAITGRKP